MFPKHFKKWQFCGQIQLISYKYPFYQGWKFTENSSQPHGWLLLKVTSPAQNLPALIKMFIVNVMIMNIQ